MPYADTDLKYRIESINGESTVTERVIVYRFNVSDSEDPDLYAAEPMYNWEKSAAGQWVIAHSTEPITWYRNLDLSSYSYQYAIVARLTSQDRTFFELKFL